MDEPVLRVEDVAGPLDPERSRVHLLIECGDLDSVEIGGSRRVPSQPCSGTWIS